MFWIKQLYINTRHIHQRVSYVSYFSSGTTFANAIIVASSFDRLISASPKYSLSNVVT